MATYAIGDIQGCYQSLLRLLDKIKFDPARDQLWFAGDLVNRGPQSLETLRFIKSLGNSAITVLGNHDLHLLALAKGSSSKKHPTLMDVLHAHDRKELLDWLRHCPLMHYDPDLDAALVHAGIPPQWKIKGALKRAAEVEAELRGSNYPQLLKHMYGNKPDKWSKTLNGNARSRYIINAFTRMRYCDKKGRLNFRYNQRPGKQPKKLYPWFEIERKHPFESRIFFGHWSTLGHMKKSKYIALDSGCVWGRKLTAVRVDKQKLKTINIKCMKKNL